MARRAARALRRGSDKPQRRQLSIEGRASGHLGQQGGATKLAESVGFCRVFNDGMWKVSGNSIQD